MTARVHVMTASAWPAQSRFHGLRCVSSRKRPVNAPDTQQRIGGAATAECRTLDSACCCVTDTKTLEPRLAIEPVEKEEEDSSM